VILLQAPLVSLAFFQDLFVRSIFIKTTNDYIKL
jgi:hypothetical protein